MLAPIILFCYNRPKHLKLTIESLLKNPLAKDSLLFVFSDGPQKNKPLDCENIEEVRKYLSKVKGFKEIIIECSEENKGLASSVIKGVTKIIKKFDKVIVLEDDLLLSHDFLSFMNSALNQYEKNRNIYSVSGYSFLLEKLGLKKEVVLVKRASSWGWGTWKDKWESTDWRLKDFDNFVNNKNLRNDFKEAGEDQLPMLLKQKKGLIDSWAIRWTYHHFVNKSFCLVPVFSKVKNIGTDGSGTNFTSKSNKYDTEIKSGSISLPIKINEDPAVTSFIKQYYKPSFYRRMLNFIRYNVR